MHWAVDLTSEDAAEKTTCPMCRSELFGDESFKVPLNSLPEEGDVADCVS